MTAELNSGFKRFADLGPRRDIGLALTIILATLASLVAAVHSAAGGREAGSLQGTALLAGTARSAPELAAVEPRQVKFVGTGFDEANVEALTDAAARKYRISSHAMREFVDTAYVEARHNGLDPVLIIAVMAVESRFNPIAQNEFGATGLMQVIPQYHADKFSATDGESVLDPRTNIRVGARVLREYIGRGGSEAAGLQLYNGAAWDESNAYANRILAERSRLLIAVRRARERLGAGLGTMG